eukprot:11501605-Ditylum_brightwellii.AAC.1
MVLKQDGCDLTTDGVKDARKTVTLTSELQDLQTAWSRQIEPATKGCLCIKGTCGSLFSK